VKVLPGVELNSGGTSGIPPIQLGDLLEPVNLAVLWNTAWIEAAVIAAVGDRRRGTQETAPGPARAFSVNTAGQATVRDGANCSTPQR
jgi:hypothetical protein